MCVYNCMIWLSKICKIWLSKYECECRIYVNNIDVSISLAGNKELLAALERWGHAAAKMFQSTGSTKVKRGPIGSVLRRIAEIIAGHCWTCYVSMTSSCTDDTQAKQMACPASHPRLEGQASYFWNHKQLILSPEEQNSLLTTAQSKLEWEDFRADKLAKSKTFKTHYKQKLVVWLTVQGKHRQREKRAIIHEPLQCLAHFAPSASDASCCCWATSNWYEFGASSDTMN